MGTPDSRPLRMRETVVIETPLACATSRSVTDARAVAPVRVDPVSSVRPPSAALGALMAWGGPRLAVRIGSPLDAEFPLWIGLSSSANVKRLAAAARGRLHGPPSAAWIATGGEVESYPDFSLAGRSALVTGAARGLGRTIALSLAHAGADV